MCGPEGFVRSVTAEARLAGVPRGRINTEEFSCCLLYTSQGSSTQASTRIGNLDIDPTTRQVTLSGNLIELSRKEFDLLWLLASRGGEVVTKRELMAAVWGLPFGGGDRTVDVHISWLRRKLGETAAAPRYLHTVRGVGIRLVPPVDP